MEISTDYQTERFSQENLRLWSIIRYDTAALYRFSSSVKSKLSANTGSLVKLI